MQRVLAFPAMTDRIRTVMRNTVWMLMSTALTRGLSYGYTILLARALGVSDFGEYIFLITYITYFGLLADFGL
ncbi:MAG TPA: oligosaccharide flippase family protein, partial [Dehalococcoidia bacterium]|nr:oligosaccharide flippase family protein [Dehalococcoidia bacterium]